MPTSNRQEINPNYLPHLPSQPTRSGASSTGTNSPIEPSGNAQRYPFPPNLSPAMASQAGSVRLGAGSPDYRYMVTNKRTRQIQEQEGLSHQGWGPPTSGNSTPLRETIPESPSGDNFPDFVSADATSASLGSTRRARAGTLPSRFSSSSGGPLPMPSSSLIPKTATARSTPSTSPFNPAPGGLSTGVSNPAAKASPQSRLRSGSMPQRPGFMSPSSTAFGNSLFSTGGWPSSRDRSSTLQSIQSQPSNGSASPVHGYSRDSLTDTDKTLHYLGLSDPQPLRATLGPSDIELMLQTDRKNTDNQNMAASRNRSYSMNAKETYVDEDDFDPTYAAFNSGTMTPADAAYQKYLDDEIQKHNREVEAFQVFSELAKSTGQRARASTVGARVPTLDQQLRLGRTYFPTSSRLDNTYTAGDMGDMALTRETIRDLSESVNGLELLNAPNNANGGDEGTLEGPTQSLWLGNIPSSTTGSSLKAIFDLYGPIESVRVLTHKNCGFVNFENLNSAIQAKSNLNGKEIFPGAGPVRIGYAKAPSASGTPGPNGLYASPSPDPHAKAQAEGSHVPSGNTTTNESRAEYSNAPLTTPELPDIREDIVQIVKELGATDEEQSRISEQVEQTIQHDNYIDIPSVEEPSHSRVHDAPKLRDIRKRIDNNSCSQTEIEQIALEMLSEVAELSSDYLGNTVVQKLFEHCCESTREQMLERIAPHLATIGIHKNGTWAAQKIIDVARSSLTLQKMVVKALAPYTASLFQDQFGNYVIQGCLRYGAPLNNFIFEGMLNRLWELAQGRYSARAMRACLESHFATKDQQRMVAAAIALHSVQLATNANGALLLTWFLDTCTFPRRKVVLAPRLVPHLVHLCTHKVAYLTVLKIINQKLEPEAHDIILKALFFSPGDQVLEDILADHNCGSTLIFKVLTTPFFDENMRADVVQNIRNVLLRIKAQPAQGYKRLMDEVNLSTRGAGSGHRDHSATRPGSSRDSPGPSNVDPASRPFYPGVAPAFDPVALQRTASMESGGFEQYPMGMSGPMFMPGMAITANAQQQQFQYQQLLAQAGRGGQFYPQMNGYPAPGPMDAFRNVAPVAGQMMQPLPIGQGMPPAMGAQMYNYGMYMPQPGNTHRQRARR